jgi:hypothetical protein
VVPPAWRPVAGSGARSAEAPRVVGVEQAQEPGHAPLQVGLYRKGGWRLGRSRSSVAVPAGRPGRPKRAAAPLRDVASTRVDRRMAHGSSSHSSPSTLTSPGTPDARTDTASSRRTRHRDLFVSLFGRLLVAFLVVTRTKATSSDRTKGDTRPGQPIGPAPADCAKVCRPGARCGAGFATRESDDHGDPRQRPTPPACDQRQRACTVARVDVSNR